MIELARAVMDRYPDNVAGIDVRPMRQIDGY